MSLTHAIKDFNIYAVYEKPNNYYYDNDNIFGISTYPFVVSSSKNKYYCQILRDLEFSFILKKNQYLKLHIVKINKNHKDKRYAIINFLLNKNNINNKNICDILFTIDISYNEIIKKETKNQKGHFSKEITFFDNNIITCLLQPILPEEINNKILTYIDTKLQFYITFHKTKNYYYFSNPSMHLPEHYILQKFKDSS